jgi:HEPN domain-containing protein
VKDLVSGVHLLIAASGLGLLVTLAAFAQTTGTQPSTQNIEELRRRLAELEKEVKELRQSVTHLEEQQTERRYPGLITSRLIRN